MCDNRGTNVPNQETVPPMPNMVGFYHGALEQEPILDKITEEIQALRGCSCWDSDGIIDDVEDIIDKYKAESEDEGDDK